VPKGFPRASRAPARAAPLGCTRAPPSVPLLGGIALSSPARWLGGLSGLIVALGCCWLVGRSGGIEVARWQLLALIALWAVAALVAAVCLTPVVGRRGGPVVLLVALAFQATALVHGPQLSDDLYRYVWDARVAAAGVDPYRFPPDDPALVPLREHFLWPTAQQCAVARADLPRDARANPFAGLAERSTCTPINRPSVRTLYPPFAQLSFRLAAAITPDRARELQVQVPAALVSLGLTGLLLGLLRRARAPAALLYAAGPLAGLEAGMDGHIDVLAALLGVAALALLARRRPQVAAVAGAAVLVALATLTKLYPALLAVVAVPRIVGSWLRATVFVATGLAVCVLLYLPHVLRVGVQVVGYLPGYLQENGYGDASRFSLVGLLGLGPTGTRAAVAVLLVGVLVAAVVRPLAQGLAAVAVRGCWVFGGAFLVVTPGDAWYCSLLLACAVLAGRPEWLAVVLASYGAYFGALLQGDPRLPAVFWGGAALVVLVAAGLRRVSAGPGQQRKGAGARPVSR